MLVDVSDLNKLLNPFTPVSEMDSSICCYIWTHLLLQTGFITKTYQYNFDPLKLHFYIVKLGFTGVYIIFIISAKNIDCGYPLESPRRGGSN